MKEIEINKHRLQMYDGIDELPIERFHKMQKALMIDAGLGADVRAFDGKMERLRRFIMKEDTKNALQELENIRLGVYLIQGEISPRMRAFAVLVCKIDGRVCEDLSDEGLDRLLNEIGGSVRDYDVSAMKKKITAELKIYFPSLFEDAREKEYYDLMRRRSLALLRGIISGGETETPEVERLTSEMYTFTHPQVFSGAGGAEVETDRNFERMCLSLSENLHVTPKKMTVLEFYNAFSYLQDKAKAAKAHKGR